MYLALEDNPEYSETERALGEQSLVAKRCPCFYDALKQKI